MSASQYRRQLENKRKQRVEAEKKAGEYRAKESTKRAAAGKAQQAAAKAKSDTTIKNKLREAERRETEAQKAGKDANTWQSRAAGYQKDEIALQAKLAKAEQSEAEAAQRQSERENRKIAQQTAATHTAWETRLAQTESAVNHVMTRMSAPKPEKLRVLMLGSSAEGDLRIGREQKRIRAAVEAALHRDQIELDSRPAATTDDLLDGITKFRPHIVHFSGHSAETVIVFEDERDERHPGVVVSAQAFASAVQATDDPPLLVLLNSCSSAAQIDGLVQQVVPFAIGMADSISDGDAINYAAQFYAAIANGQSISAADRAGRARLELDGLDGFELPRLATAPGADPENTILVASTDGG